MEVGRAGAAADDVEAGPLEELLEHLEYQLVRSGENDARAARLRHVRCAAATQGSSSSTAGGELS